MVESAILGIVQGIAEWLPVSSEGLLVLLKVNLFQSSLRLVDLVNYALFLHLGTFLAALIYFRKEVWKLISALFNYRKTREENQKLIKFYFLATLISGMVGLIILKSLEYIEEEAVFGGRGLNLLIGLALLITALLQFKKKSGLRKPKDLKSLDGIILGFLQGLAIIPGLSRSGLTVSGLLLRRFNDNTALRLSFIMSLPVVLGANIILNFKYFVLSVENFIGLFLSFLFGILTIHLLLKISQKINFAWFVLVFALIVLISIVI